MWNELCSLRFVDAPNDVVILGPVRVDKTFLATALGHIATSNRDPGEMLAQMADPLLAQSAIDRLHSNAHELVIDGESYRRRQRPTLDSEGTTEP